MNRFVWMLALVVFVASPAPAQDPHHPLRDALRASRGALAAGDAVRAVESAARAVKADPGSFEAWKQYGRALQLSARNEEALTAFRAAQAINPDDPEIHRWIADLWIDELRGEALAKALDSLPPDLWLSATDGDMAARGLRLWEDGRQEDARLLLMKFDQSPMTELNALLEGQRGPAAERLAKRAGDPFAPLLAFALAEDSIRRGRLPQALDDLNRAAVLLPGRVSVRRERGWVYFRLGRYREAEQIWSQKVTAQDPPIEWQLWIARSQDADDRKMEALSSINLFLESYPVHPEALALKGSTLLSLQGMDAAEDFWKTLDDASLRTTVTAAARMRYDRDQGRFEQAANHLAPLLAQPGFPVFLASEYERLLQRWVAATPPDQRWTVLERSVAWKPERPAWRRDLGWSYWAAGRGDEAIKTLAAALKAGVEPREPIILQVVARLVEEGQMDTALAFFKTHAGVDNPDLGKFGRDLVIHNRVVAARPILELAWKEGDRNPLSGLYLGYARSLAGSCANTTPLLQPFLEGLNDNTDPAETDLFLEILHHCGRDAELIALLEVHPLLRDEQRSYAPNVTDLIQEHALYLLAAHRVKEAMPHVLRVLERDPARPLWSRAIESAQRLNDTTLAASLMGKAPLDRLPAWESARVRGLQALNKGDVAAAAAAYEESLTQQPKQVDLIARHFRLLIGLHRDPQATRWMEVLREEVDAGQSTSAVDVADMLDELGRPSESAYYWELARIQSPSVAYYTVSAARALADSCSAEEALALLRRALESSSDPTLSATAAELALALGNPQEAAELADAGLAADALHPALLRIRAELAERLEEWEIASELSQRALRENPGSEPMRLLHGRALLKEERMDEAKVHFEAMLDSPNLLVPAYARLRDIHTLRGETAKALSYTRRLAEIRPGDPEITRLLGASLAEDRSFREATDLLTPLASRPITDAVPVLLFPRVEACPLPGVLSVQHIAHLMERLTQDGWILIPPEQIADPVPEGTRRVVLVFDQLRPQVMPELTRLLNQYNTGAFLHRPPRFPAEMEGRERWKVLDQLEESDPAFVVGEGLPNRLSAKRIPPYWSYDDLLSHLTNENPLISARLSLAKAYYWQNQAPRADYWFDQARAADADPFEVAFNKGMNALRSGDYSMAVKELNEALRINPDHERTREELATLESKRATAVGVSAFRSDDSDDRSFTRWGASASGYLSENDEVFGFGDYLRYARDGFGYEEGWRVGLGVKTHLAELTELDLAVFQTKMDTADDFVGWDARLRLPSRRWSGHLDLVLARNAEETVEAVREGILQDHAGLHGYARLRDLWDLYLNADGLFRSDGNATGQGEVRLTRRFSEVPYFGLGVRSRYADSERDSPLYYTPDELQKHQVYFNLRTRSSEVLRLSLSGEAGVARERDEDWMFVWGARGELAWEVVRTFELLVGASYMESPRYDLTTVYAALKWIP